MDSCPSTYDGMKMGNKGFPAHQRDEQYRRINDMDATTAVTATTTSIVSTSTSSTTTIPSIPATAAGPKIGRRMDEEWLKTGRRLDDIPHPPPAAAPTIAAPSAHSALDSSVAASGRTNSPAVATSAVLSAVAPAINGNSNATTVAANGSIAAYRNQGYAPYALYAPYIAAHMHHGNPYIPPAIPSPSASPRTVDSRSSRESPMVNSKGIRPMTPTTINNGIQSQLPAPQTAAQSASSSNSLREQQQSQHSTPLSLQKAHSPRGHSPTRERDSYR